ncbi:gamma-glutamyl-gamma-aminobutyrate hydrolase family protein [Marinihelvus fidelis]|uniref:gamma-glutamyl-gamma-aminobutyrate hydrolase family protein n=1 Tax=Marinihelvus fidelis TaxID=2613842 RepID=UPI001CD66A5E|nr:gamma-glutamyl-gamma-aminobutyrate hydrolase family protein [Marinihelvus fidelis]
MSSPRPLVGVVADRRMVGPHPFHMAGEKYLAALVDGAGVDPVVLPSFGEGFEVAGLLERLDGLLLTGSPSNVAPARYDGPSSAPGTLHDPERDVAAFDLVPAALKMGLPLLAICRGFQELNVAMGGSLHQAVHERPGALVHHEDYDAPVEVQYGPAHEVSFVEGGLLRELTGQATATVNSLHSQGVDRLGQGLRVEALAPDGLVEAFVVADAPGFTLGVQWHPEWKVTASTVSMALFGAFGDACRAFSEQVHKG